MSMQLASSKGAFRCVTGNRTISIDMVRFIRGIK